MILESDVFFPELVPYRPEKQIGKSRTQRIRIYLYKRAFPLLSFQKRGIRYGGFRYQFNPGGRFVMINSPSVGRFQIDFRKKEILWDPLKKDTDQLARATLKGRVLGFMLSNLLPSLPLHAAALSQGKNALAFCGPFHLGKSTLAASLLKYGFSLVTDDLALIGGAKRSFSVSPGPPEIRLWPSSIKILNSFCFNHELLYPGTRKERFLVRSNGHPYSRKTPVSLKVLYFLDRGKNPKIQMQDLRNREAILEILRNVYNPILRNSKTMSLQFKRAVDLTKGVRVKRLTYPSGYKHLKEVGRAILRDFKSNC